MLMIGLARIGNEPVVRYTADNKAVLDLNLAYNYGRKDANGMYPTQWIYASMFGERVEKLSPYLKKGGQIVVELSDVHIDNYTKKDGTPGSSLKAKLSNLTLVSEKKETKSDQPMYDNDEPPF